MSGAIYGLRGLGTDRRLGTLMSMSMSMSMSVSVSVTVKEFVRRDMEVFEMTVEYHLCTDVILFCV